jgi:GT2 family glycosyltransferase
MKKIRVVCASRAAQGEFFQTTALGRSWMPYESSPACELLIYPANTTALPEVYNHAIDAAVADPAILVFVHDDVYLCDFFWRGRVREAVERFDIIGVAGNRRRTPRQPSWLFTDLRFNWDAKEYLSGAIGHGLGFPCNNISVYGPSMQACKLLDGVMLCVESRKLHEHGLRFDASFPFHFYDLDFCRQAERKGLSMGTWPIAIIHESPGKFASPEWQEAYARYLEKYGERGQP